MIKRLQEKYNYSEKKDTRSGFGEGVFLIAQKNKDVLVLCADLSGSLKLGKFIKEYPNRFFQAGIAEANMIGVAAGMTIGGKIPFTCTFANFATARVYDQIRQSVAYSEKNVKICASHAGITLGEDGATHQILEDIGMMKMLPNMTVINTCDFNQTKAATIAIASYKGPVYLRFGRPKVPVFMTEKFEIGKGIILSEGQDVSIIATGHLVWEAIKAHDILLDQNISCEVINIHTIKPLDSSLILKSVNKTKAVVTAEEHMMNGGLGDSIAQLLAQNNPVPQEYVAINDKFGESGTPEELMKKYCLKAENIVEAVKKVIDRKQD